eukprot:12883549-Prorocentrum_lima.AAC.1
MHYASTQAEKIPQWPFSLLEELLIKHQSVAFPDDADSWCFVHQQLCPVTGAGGLSMAWKARCNRGQG